LGFQPISAGFGWIEPFLDTNLTISCRDKRLLSGGFINLKLLIKSSLASSVSRIQCSLTDPEPEASEREVGVDGIDMLGEPLPTRIG
jgi:hypothetical protein